MSISVELIVRAVGAPQLEFRRWPDDLLLLLGRSENRQGQEAADECHLVRARAQAYRFRCNSLQEQLLVNVATPGDLALAKYARW